MNNIRNFSIIAHIDHGKSTLADRLLELTGAVEKRKMQAQVLDTMDLEREHGITIKLQPAKMSYTPMNAGSTDRGCTRTENPMNTDGCRLLYENLTYKIRGAVFKVQNQLGSGHKESLYQNALEEEIKNQNISYEKEKNISISYNNKTIGVYRPDFVIEGKIIIELKALPFLGKEPKKQLWHYLKGTDYKLALLINFGSSKAEIERVVYDTIRDHLRSDQRPSAYILNLIDTPGHVDFGYEVSRSLAAVEGALLVVDATQGVQAQTLANLYQAYERELTIIPVINKIDLAIANVEETIAELESLKIDFACEPILISAKTGENVESVLDAVVKFVPPPKGNTNAPTRALIFDSYYDSYRGVVAYVRVVDGEINKGDAIEMIQTKQETEALETGAVCLGLHPSDKISTGDIGYIVTTLKDVSGARVGDTITKSKVESRKLKEDTNPNAPSTLNLLPSTGISPLPGYAEPQPVVFAGLYTTSGADLSKLREALGKLKLNDASLSYEPQNSKAFGFGFKAGFLGLLHLEIVKERLEREYNLDLIVTTPTVDYKHISQNSKLKNQNDGKDLSELDTHLTPNVYTSTQYLEPWIKLEIITPQKYLGAVMQLTSSKRGIINNVEYMSDRVVACGEMPLADAIVDYYDRLKAVTSGYGSLSYEISGYRPADLVPMDILVAEEVVEPLSRLVPREQVQGASRQVVERLKDLIPRQNFEVKIQAAVHGKILASERLSPFRKDVTAKLYGGDITRKRKLLEKQKKGKKKMARIGNLEVPTDVFVKLLRQ